MRVSNCPTKPEEIGTAKLSSMCIKNVSTNVAIKAIANIITILSNKIKHMIRFVTNSAIVPSHDFEEFFILCFPKFIPIIAAMVSPNTVINIETKAILKSKIEKAIIIPNKK